MRHIPLRDQFEVEILIKGRHRFHWRVRDSEGKIRARGEAVTVAAARVEAGFARLGVIAAELDE
jgi:hypothetical protein